MVGGTDVPAWEKQMPDKDEVEVHYATAEKDRIVPAGHPDARYVVNPADPGEFEDLLKAHKRGDHKAQKPAEDKGFEPLPPGNPERERHDAAKRKA